MQSFIEMNLHVSLHILDNREKPSMPSYSPEEIGRWIMHLSPNNLLSEH